MNLTLLPMMTPAGDAATDGLTPAADSDALSSAFAQLLGERFRPAGQRADAPQLQTPAADAQPAPNGEALSRLLSTPERLATLANLTERMPTDAATTPDDEPESPPVAALKAQDAPDAATLQALLAMLPPTAAPLPDEQRAAAPPADHRPAANTPAPANALMTALHDDAAPPAERIATPAALRQTSAPQNSDAALPPATKPDAFSVERLALNGDGAPAPTPQHAIASPASGVQFTTPQPAAAPTAPAAPLLNAPLGSPEWQQALSQQVLMFQRGGQQSAELRLHPQELGSLQITLKLDDQQAQLHIASAHGQVRAAVEAAMPQLRHALAESGINLGQSSVGGDPSPQQSQQQTSQEHGRPSSYREQHGGAELPTEASAAPPALQALARAVDGVDIFA
ncbi:Flagellar hook-length control protein [Serratia rubidaea]|uniref:Flagellar hook-length control protein n=1 Tax=Serratia rubidaea TaxID=61652 RepID=A0A4U9HIW2_SERRU|nr:flagellar hook-length control protein FliK [Serratia rubidaea]QPR63250.1 flagellar hook-length control protein FliK [Serratia rubidaea]CAI0750390.1 Flagellar hook-length control protein [Serratia rubidaea]CAI1557272.1 Flagellar hook-length control protein [Serratia rubidaea]VTP63987.1 Flagellar hook-length control protein [Serratia rubidaea]HAY0635242.1 flagellar hook-length control protein FliK [Serratia rubidaea]